MVCLQTPRLFNGVSCETQDMSSLTSCKCEPRLFTFECAQLSSLMLEIRQPASTALSLILRREKPKQAEALNALGQL